MKEANQSPKTSLENYNLLIDTNGHSWSGKGFKEKERYLMGCLPGIGSNLIH
ncbi:MAG: hypothetical protein ACJAU0_000130 [Flavobacteriales bacterium]|jgi:hypothetical protein